MSARIFATGLLACLIGACASNSDDPAETNKSTTSQPTSRPTSKPSMPTSTSRAASFEDADVETVARMIAADPDIVLLDIRTPAEFARSRMPGSINIDYRAEGYAEKLDELDKSKTYVMY